MSRCFVKTPGQREGRIDDRPAMLYDVLPTITDVLEVESPWPMEGVSLLDDHPDSFSPRVFEGYENIDLPPNPVMDDAIARKVDLFGSGTGWDTVYSFGPYRDLVGQSVEIARPGRLNPHEIEIRRRVALRPGRSRHRGRSGLDAGFGESPTTSRPTHGWL